MASRRLVPASVRETLLGIASDIGSLERKYVLPDEDLELIATRRRPDQDWLDGIAPPAPAAGCLVGTH